MLRAVRSYEPRKNYKIISIFHGQGTEMICISGIGIPGIGS